MSSGRNLQEQDQFDEERATVSSSRSMHQSASGSDRCFPPKCRFVILLVLNSLELICGLLLWMFGITIYVRLYVGLTRGLIEAFLIVILIVWSKDAQAQIMKKILLLTFVGTIMLDLIGFYLVPDMTDVEYDFSNTTFMWIASSVGVYYLLKIMGLFFSCYHVNLAAREN